MVLNELNEKNVSVKEILYATLDDKTKKLKITKIK